MRSQRLHGLKTKCHSNSIHEHLFLELMLSRKFRKCISSCVAVLGEANTLVLTLLDSSLQLEKKVEVKLWRKRCCKNWTLDRQTLRVEIWELAFSFFMALWTLTSLWWEGHGKLPSDGRQLEIFKRKNALGLLLHILLGLGESVFLGLFFLDVKSKNQSISLRRN